MWPLAIISGLSGLANLGLGVADHIAASKQAEQAQKNYEEQQAKLNEKEEELKKKSIQTNKDISTGLDIAFKKKRPAVDDNFSLSGLSAGVGA